MCCCCGKCPNLVDSSARGADGSTRSLAYQFVIGLPLSNTLLPVVVPTLYLWVVDTLALKRGTWVIESGTKLGWHLWDGLEIECVGTRLGGFLKLTGFQRSGVFRLH